MRDRVEALERVAGQLRRLEALRARRLCVLAPAVEEGWSRAFFVAGGRVCAVRTLPPGAGARIEAAAGVAAAAAVAHQIACEPDATDELLAVGAFLRRPPPELSVVPLDVVAIVREHGRRTATTLAA